MSTKTLLLFVIAIPLTCFGAFAPGSASTEAETLTLTAAAGETQTCPRCGYENKAGLNYCTMCGAPLIEEAPGEKIYCRQCGATSPEASKFCTGCGRAGTAERSSEEVEGRNLFFGTAKFSVFPRSRVTPYGILFSFGVRLPYNMSLSFGTGFETWSAQTLEGGFATDFFSFTIPLLFKYKYGFLNRQVSPAAYAGVGCGISKLKCSDPWYGGETKTNKVGLLLNLGGGVDFYVSKNFAFAAEVGWRGTVGRTYDDSSGEEGTGVGNSFQIGWGIIF